MTTYRITTPVPGYTGNVGAIAFANGTAYINDEQAAALAYFRDQGYLVEDTSALAADQGDPAAAFANADLDAANARIAELEAQLAAAQTPTKTSGTAAKGATK